MAPRLHEIVAQYLHLGEDEGLPGVLAELRGDNGRTLAREVDTETGQLLLHVATYCDSCEDMSFRDETFEELILLLISLFPEGVNQRDNTGQNAIHYAVTSCSEKVIQAMLNIFPEGLETEGADGSIPLHSALVCGCQPNKEQILRFLVAKHPKGLEATDTEGRLPIHWAARGGLSLETVQYLYERFPKLLEQTDKVGRLPAHYAAKGCCLGVLKYMIQEYPLSLRQQDEKGKLPLHYAAYSRLDGCLKYLIDMYPGGLRQKDNEGNSPLHCAVDSSGSKTLEAIKLLVDKHPAALIQRNDDGYVPVDLAVRTFYPSMEIIKYLVENHPKPNGTEPIHLPIHAAIDMQVGEICVIKYLVEKNPACLQQEDGAGNLPIHIAVKRNLCECAKYLVGEFSDGLKHKNKDGLLPIHCDFENSELFFLLAKGYPQSLLDSDKPTRKYLERVDTSEGPWIDLIEALITAVKSERNTKEKQQVEHSEGNDDPQLQQSLAMYKMLAQDRTKSEKALQARLVDPESNTSMKELKSFATTLKDRIDRMKKTLTPTAKPSMTQVMFPSFIADANLSRDLLVDCIENLDAELTGLEADLDEVTDGCGGNGQPDVAATASAGAGDAAAGTERKRRRRSPLYM